MNLNDQYISQQLFLNDYSNDEIDHHLDSNNNASIK